MIRLVILLLNPLPVIARSVSSEAIQPYALSGLLRLLRRLAMTVRVDRNIRYSHVI